MSPVCANLIKNSRTVMVMQLDFLAKYSSEKRSPGINLPELIKDKKFVSYKTANDDTTYRGRSNEIYFPNNELLKYFEPKSDTKFVDLDDYYSFITDEKDKVILKEFLLKLGVSEQPRILTRVISDWRKKNNIKTRLGESLRYGSSGYGGQGTFDKIIDGCKEIY